MIRLAKNFNECIDKVSKKIFVRVRDSAISNLKDMDKIVTGGVADSLRIIIGNGERKLYSTHPAIRNVEYGRDAGSKPPPMYAIAEWFMNKHGLSKKEAWARANGAVNAIAKYGIKPSFFLRSAKFKELRK